MKKPFAITLLPAVGKRLSQPWKQWLYILLIIVFLTFTTLVSLTGRQLGPWRILIVRTGSMAPRLPVESLIVIKREPTYAVGQIITFLQHEPRHSSLESTTITHRIVEVRPQELGIFYATKGDANTVMDDHYVPQDEVLGRVIATIPWIGKFIDWQNTPTGALLLILLPGAFIVSTELVRIAQELTTEP